jgi:hypothetical protein
MWLHKAYILPVGVEALSNSKGKLFFVILTKSRNERGSNFFE